MAKLMLDADEVILLEEQEVYYSGSIDKLDYIDRIILTNKRIICNWEEKRVERTFEIHPNEIKRYNGALQVDYYEDDEIGQCLRIQTINAVELFAIGENESESIRESFKSMFSSNKKENKKVALWVSKILEAFDGKDIKTHEESINQREKAQEVSREEVNMIICPECGKKYVNGTKFCPSCGTPTNKPKVVEIEKVIEVIRCRKCGAKMNADTKFCPECGTPVIEEPKTETPKQSVSYEKKESRESKIQKCPICGEILSSDTITCPSCGHEIRGRQAVDSVKAFFDSISSITDEDKKIEAIKMYVIPNNREDIMEFMLLATSNFDAKLYATNKQGENIASAWHTKIEQCYKKAKLMFTDENDIQKIEKLYNESESKAAAIKKAKLIMTIAGIAMIILSIILISVSPRSTAEDGTTTSVGVLGYISMGILAVGIIVLVIGLKKKKTNKQIEEARIAKLNKKNKN